MDTTIWKDHRQRKYDKDYKYCEGCWDYWRKEEFSVSTRWPDGLQKKCKVCNPSGIEPPLYTLTCIKCGRIENNFVDDLNPWTCYRCTLSPEKQHAYDVKTAYYAEEARIYKEEAPERWERRIEALPDYVRDGSTSWDLFKKHKCGLRVDKEKEQERKARKQKKQKEVKNLRNRIYRATRKARLLGAPTNFTWEKWMQKVLFYGSKCVYCNKPLDTKTLTCDHFKPLKHNGTHFIANLVPACRSCNCKKHTSTWKILYRAIDKKVKDPA